MPPAWDGRTKDMHMPHARPLKGSADLERIWNVAVHGALAFDAHEEMMAGCGKGESRLICLLCTYDLGWESLCTLNFYVSEVMRKRSVAGILSMFELHGFILSKIGKYNIKIK